MTKDHSNSYATRHTHAHQHTTKSAKNILVAFILNLGFSIYEFIGGTLTGSVAIVSDSIHDIGDALSIGIAYLLEKRSQKAPDANYTYGYLRYSLIGGLITTIILIFGSSFVILNAVTRLFQPVEIHYDSMILLALIGVVVNFLAAWFTHGSHSLNQKSVNLHMLEDVLGWVVVLIGAIVMRFTNWYLLDPILSIAVAIFILKEAVSNCLEILEIFLEKTPHYISIKKLEQGLLNLPHVENVHHLHIWALDNERNYATVHIVYQQNEVQTKNAVREYLLNHNLSHVTIEMESPTEKCQAQDCGLFDETD